MGALICKYKVQFSAYTFYVINKTKLVIVVIKKQILKCENINQRYSWVALTHSNTF